MAEVVEHQKGNGTTSLSSNKDSKWVAYAKRAGLYKKVQCECGWTYARQHRARHMKTKRHLAYLYLEQLKQKQ